MIIYLCKNDALLFKNGVVVVVGPPLFNDFMYNKLQCNALSKTLVQYITVSKYQILFPTIIWTKYSE